MKARAPRGRDGRVCAIRAASLLGVVAGLAGCAQATKEQTEVPYQSFHAAPLDLSRPSPPTDASDSTKRAYLLALVDESERKCQALVERVKARRTAGASPEPLPPSLSSSPNAVDALLSALSETYVKDLTGYRLHLAEPAETGYGTVGGSGRAVGAYSGQGSIVVSLEVVKLQSIHDECSLDSVRGPQSAR